MVLTALFTVGIVAANRFGYTKQERLMTLGERLKQARLARNMSLAALARLSGLSKGFLSQVETGAANPSLASLQRLVTALSISLSDLVATEAARTQAAAGRPRLVRRVQPELDRSSLTQTGAGSHGLVYVAHLLPGGFLESATPPGGEDAYLMVISGEVQFSQPGTSLRLGQGDSLTFPLSQHYRLASQSGLRASLLLIVRSARDLPRLVDMPLVERLPVRREGELSVAAFQGPLRLVAMRAARRADGGRKA
jgi:transcriptional regulator with XRE-family HTH domain